jgi:hypothetical protein
MTRLAPKLCRYREHECAADGTGAERADHVMGVGHRAQSGKPFLSSALF